MSKLWQTSNSPHEGRLPIRIKKHSRFLGGLTLTLAGTRWARTYGVLPSGTRLTVVGTPDWLGGLVWRTSHKASGPLSRPALALCKRRYR